jgi:hypothetical protein
MALIITCEKAIDMWLKLHSVFEQQTKQAAHTVQAEFSFMQTLTDDIVTHIAKFEGLVLRMQQLNVKLYLGQPTDIVIKKRGCGLVA